MDYDDIFQIKINQYLLLFARVFGDTTKTKI